MSFHKCLCPYQEQTQPHCATKSSSSSEDFHQHKLQFLATESSCHEQESDCALPYCLEVLQLLLFCPMKKTKFPPNVIQLSHTWFAGRISLWIRFLLLFNPLREKHFKNLLSGWNHRCFGHKSDQFFLELLMLLALNTNNFEITVSFTAAQPLSIFALLLN